jgi:membrane-associated phospholipid phosphatase
VTGTMTPPPRVAIRLHAADVLTVAFVTALSVLVVANAARVPHWRHVVVVCGLVASSVLALAWMRAHSRSAIVRFLHDWSLAPIVYVLYREMFFVTGPLHGGRVIDGALIAADRWLFGTEPTAWIGGFAQPAVTELLQVAYTSFYVLILTVGGELWRRTDDRAFRRYLFACGVTFYVSFVGYLVAPAIGPRMTLYDVATLERQMPGLWLTPYLRWFVNAGGLVPRGLSGAAAAALAHRDAFPSGHAMVTIVLMVHAWRNRLATRWFVTPAGTLLVLATVYLRYHYVIDVLAGGLLACACLAAAPLLQDWIGEVLDLRGLRLPDRPAPR